MGRMGKAGQCIHFLIGEVDEVLRSLFLWTVFVFFLKVLLKAFLGVGPGGAEGTLTNQWVLMILRETLRECE